LRFTGRDVRRRSSAISSRTCPALSIAQGSAPSPPASDTAAANSQCPGPAIGAKRIGRLIPNTFNMNGSGHMADSRRPAGRELADVRFAAHKG
jgi:hypothetical protein